MSPIINPMYVSYSHARGVRYKMRFRSQYNFSAHRYLTLNPTFGYTFKEHQFYFTAPLRMTYNPKRNGYTEVIFGNGNRISTSTVMDVINAAHQDTINFDNTDMDKFKDHNFWDRSVGLSFRMSNKIFYNVPLDISLTLARGLNRIGESNDTDRSTSRKLNPIDLPVIPDAVSPTRIKLNIGMGFANTWQ